MDVRKEWTRLRVKEARIGKCVVCTPLSPRDMTECVSLWCFGSLIPMVAFGTVVVVLVLGLLLSSFVVVVRTKTSQDIWPLNINYLCFITHRPKQNTHNKTATCIHKILLVSFKERMKHATSEVWEEKTYRHTPHTHKLFFCFYCECVLHVIKAGQSWFSFV